MNVLVTGGTGFLGRYIAREFQATGHDVRAVGQRDGGDLTQARVARELLQRERPDLLVNCAALQGGLEFVKRYPARIFADNLLINLNVLGAAAETSVKRVVNVLAACSYPGQVTGTLREEAWWDGPLHDSVLAYGLTKKAAWAYAWCLAAEGRLAVTNLLLANLYGPGEHLSPERSHALGALLVKIVEAKRTGARQVEIWGTGRPVRDWLFVEDAARAVLAAAGLEGHLHLYNVGSGYGISIADLAECIQQVVGWEGEFYYDAEKPEGALLKVLDCSRFQQATGWSPSVSLQEGIHRTVAAYDDVERTVAVKGGVD